MQVIRDYKNKRLIYKSFLFKEIHFNEGWAIPSKHFLEMWNSDKREAVIRSGFTLLPVIKGDVRLVGRSYYRNPEARTEQRYYEMFDSWCQHG